MKNRIFCPQDTKLKDYLLAINAVKKIPVYKLEELCVKYAACTDEKNREKMRPEIIEQNLKQVISIAAGYRGAGLTFASLIGAGNKALIDCVINLIPDETENISAYIAWCIEGGVIDSIVNAKKTIDKNGRV